MNTKEKKELQKSADTITRDIAEKFTKLFTDKIDEMIQEFSGHLDDHMDDLEAMIEEGFDNLHEHLKVLDRVEKLEKKIESLESGDKRKRFVV